ncbi:MAG: hypothetical protein Q7T82_14975, partial [Armatimonadota bacterium]|nr:hypothetical protein [Armatimonadota bacterium]
YTPGVVGGVGTNNIGLHVTVFGNVTALGSGFFYLDDGSAPSDPRIDPGTGQPYVGVRVLSSASVGLDEYWTATGISTVEADGASLVRAVRATNAQRMQ